MTEDRKKQFWERDTWSDPVAQATPERGRRAGWAAVYAMTHDVELADDAGQEAVLEILLKKKPSDFNDEEHLIRYVRRCAVCRAISQLRKMKRWRRLGEFADAVADDGLDPMQLAQWYEIGKRVRRAIASLPPKRRRMFEARLVGKTGKEIAHDEGVSEANVSRQLSAALAAVRRELDTGDVDPQLWDLEAIAAAVATEDGDCERGLGPQDHGVK